ncbi:hypothetical protein D3C80_2084640 [compost metagenome]
MRSDQAGFATGCGEGRILAFQAQPFSTGLEQRTQHLWPYRAIRYCQYLCMCIGQCQALDMWGAFMVLVEQVQIGAGAVVDE